MCLERYTPKCQPWLSPGEEIWGKFYSVVYMFMNYLKAFFLKKRLFIYSWDTHRKRQRHRQREKQAPCREPDAEFNPKTPGSRPEPKADSELLSHPGILIWSFLMIKLIPLKKAPEETQLKHGLFWEAFLALGWPSAALWLPTAPSEHLNHSKSILQCKDIC